jgi:phosphoribosylanthranilate isomerase
MTRFKICGLRETGHAVTAAEAGADFLGFVFVHGVRRQLSEEQAAAIIQEYRTLKGPGGPSLVGLFANQPLEEVNRIIERCSLDFAQLCGDERPDYWRHVEAPIIKQVRVSAEGERGAMVAEVLRRVDEVVSGGQTALLDRHEKGALGGTGLSFDWGIAAEVAERFDFLLAGGLTPENVGRAIGTAKPWGVDVSSGVETDGVKDPGKITAFAEEVQRASRGLKKSQGAAVHPN